MRVPLVNKITQCTSPVYCIMWDHLLPFTLFYLPPPLFSDNHRAGVCLEFVCLIPLPFPPTPQTASPLTAISLFSVSLNLFLFCLFVYFVHQILHISEIIGYLSFSDWLISLSTIFSRSIRTVTKYKISFFFTAEQCSIA